MDETCECDVVVDYGGIRRIASIVFFFLFEAACLGDLCQW